MWYKTMIVFTMIFLLLSMVVLTGCIDDNVNAQEVTPTISIYLPLMEKNEPVRPTPTALRPTPTGEPAPSLP